MLSININLASFTGIKLGQHVTGVGVLLPHGSAAPPASSAVELTVPWRTLQATPELFSLLSWHTHISQFKGRDAEFAELQAWAHSDQPISARFMTGDGGVGKSRLAGEFATALANEGWAAGFVDLRKPQSFFLKEAGTLLVIDYPEENRDSVSELFGDLSTLGEGGRLRILFLTRQNADGWLQLAHDRHSSDFVEMKSLLVGELKGVPAHGLYISALERAAEVFDTTPLPLSEEALEGWLQEAPENSRALFILAAAVHGALHPEDSAVRYSGGEVVQVLVKREIDRLRAIASSIDAPDLYCLARVLAVAAIADGLPLPRIVALAADTRVALGFNGDRNLSADLKSSGTLRNGVAHSPKPDIIAAAFVAEILRQSPGTAPEIVWAGLVRDTEGGLERLGRLCYDAEVVLGITSPRLSTVLPSALRGDVARCRAIDDFVSSTRLPVGILTTAVEVWKTLLSVSRDESERARLLNNLSSDLTEAGNREGALTAIRESVEIRRRLSSANPARYEPVLASSLNNLSGHLSKTGDREGALAAIREAVELYRRWSSAIPARYEPELASSLCNLSNRLSETGDREGALTAIREAIAVIRPYAERYPGSIDAQRLELMLRRLWTLTGEDDDT